MTPRPASASAVIPLTSSDKAQRRLDCEFQDCDSQTTNNLTDELTLDLSRLNSSLSNFYKKNVSFVDANGTKGSAENDVNGDSDSKSSTDERLKQLIESDNREIKQSPDLKSSSRSPDETVSVISSSPVMTSPSSSDPWFLDPPHHLIRSEDNIRSDRSIYDMSASSSPVPFDENNDMDYKYLILKYFPVTLGGIEPGKFKRTSPDQHLQAVEPRTPAKYDFSTSNPDMSWSPFSPEFTSSDYKVRGPETLGKRIKQYICFTIFMCIVFIPAWQTYYIHILKVFCNCSKVN